MTQFNEGDRVRLKKVGVIEATTSDGVHWVKFDNGEDEWLDDSEIMSAPPESEGSNE